MFKLRCRRSATVSRRIHLGVEALEDRTVPAFALQLTGTQVILPLNDQGTYATGTGSGNRANDN